MNDQQALKRYFWQSEKLIIVVNEPEKEFPLRICLFSEGNNDRPARAQSKYAAAHLTEP